MTTTIAAFRTLAGVFLMTLLTLATPERAGAQGGDIHQATLAEPNQKTAEVGTEELGASSPTRARWSSTPDPISSTR